MLPRPDARSTASATLAWSMCVNPLIATTSPEIRVAASWISDAIPAHRACRRAPLQTAWQWWSGDDGRNPVERFDRDRSFRREPADLGVDTVIGEPVADQLLALGLLNRREGTPCDPGRQAGHAKGIDGGQLSIGQVRRAYGARGFLRLTQPVLEQRRAAFDGRRRVVQFVRESGREFAERESFRRGGSLDVNTRARSSMVWTRIDVICWHSRTINSRSAEGRQRVRWVPARWSLPGGLTRRESGKHPGDIAGAPSRLVPPCATIDKNRDAAAQDDEEPGDR